MAIEACIWRDEKQQRQTIIQAWQTAVLMRAKKIPSLKQLLDPKPARPLRGKELEERRNEFKRMTKNLDMSKLVPKK